jgi:hypothetical protein
MIVIWGLKKVIIKSLPLYFETCPSCETKGATSAHYYTRYAHIFWIPIFPIRIVEDVRCGKCQNKNDNPYIVIANKKSISHPVWTFSGLIFFVVSLIKYLIS